MKKKYLLVMTIAVLLQWSCTSGKNESKESEAPRQVAFKIMFGSCADQDKPQPLLNIAIAEKPDAFVYLGDNIYGDSYIMDTLRAKYKRLGNKPEFQKLWNTTDVYATWDDHDFGWNDAGRHYPFKEESKEIFLEFWQVPQNSERRQHEGIYGVEYLEKDGKKIQLLLLDTRTFRDELVHRESSDQVFKNDYVPNTSADSTFLGDAQWNWLEKQLGEPADFRLIASSNQFSHEYNGWESWTNVPHERKKFIDLIKKTRANHVVFISGDVHWGELSKQSVAGGYPIYDATSSGITQEWHNVEPNENRIGEPLRQNNIGMMELTWNGDQGSMKLSLMDITGKAITTHKINLLEIAFDK